MLQEVRLLCAGYSRVDWSIFKMGNPTGTLVRAPAWMYLLRSTDGLMLVDTGMPKACIDNAHYFDEPGQPLMIVPEMGPDDWVERVLARQGLEVQDIDAVISTHWHFDHAGGIQLFRHQPIYVHPLEMAAGRTGAYPPECSDPTLNYRPIGDGYQPTPGVTLLHTPGHTPGHLSVYLEPAAGRPILLTIDAVYTLDNWQSDVPGEQADPETGRRSVARLKEVALSGDAAVFFGHDPEQEHESFWRTQMGQYGAATGVDASGCLRCRPPAAPYV